MPIKGLTERARLPRLGKIHLGIKAKNKRGIEYPKAVDYFVYPEPDALGGELLPQLKKAFGEKPKKLRIIFPLEDEETIASQYYRCYTRTRGLVCRGDGEICMRMVDKKTGDLPTKESTKTEMKEMTCQGRECPDYQSGNCRELMNLQFILPEISGLGIWQIDTSSINSIRNTNSCLQMIRAVYGRVSMVPLLLTLEKIEVTPPGGTKKNVFVLNIRSTDNMIEAAIKARKPPLELIAGPADIEQAEKDIEELWPADEQERMLSKEEAAERLTPQEIEETRAEEQESPQPKEKRAKAKDQPAPEAKEEQKKEEQGETEGFTLEAHPEGFILKVHPEGDKGLPTAPPELRQAGGEVNLANDWLDWWNERKKKIHWTDKTAISWIKAQFKIKEDKPLDEMLALLTPEQKEMFFNHIDSLYELA